MHSKSTPENTSSSNSHTAWSAGPWYLDDEYWDDVRAGNDKLVANVYGRGNDDEAKANARLIAAAPELYEALKNLLALSRPHFSDSTQILAFNLAESAIAKAEGR